MDGFTIMLWFIMQLFAFTILNICLVYCQNPKGFIGKSIMEKWNSSQTVTYLSISVNSSF